MKFKLIIDPAKEEEILATVHERSELTERIEELVLQHSGSDRIVAYTNDDIKLLPFTQIECISVLAGKTWAIDTRGQHFRLRQRLCELEPLLPSTFIRINKSALANTARLDRFAPSFSGAVDAIFMSGHRDYVSRRCFAEIKRRYGL